MTTLVQPTVKAAAILVVKDIAEEAVKVVTIHAKEVAVVLVKQVVKENVAVVQDVQEHVKVPVNSDVQVEININYSSYGKRHFISPRVFQEFTKEIFALSCRCCYASTTNPDVRPKDCNEL